MLGDGEWKTLVGNRSLGGGKAYFVGWGGQMQPDDVQMK
jgi:hypothetical protein